MVERVWGRGRDRLPFVLRWGLTFLLVNIAWVFFRHGLCRGLELLGRAVTGGFAKPAAWLLEGLFAEETSAVQMLIPAFTPWKNILRVVLLYGAGMTAALWPRNVIRRMEDFCPTLWRGVVVTVLTAWCVLSVQPGSPPSSIPTSEEGPMKRAYRRWVCSLLAGVLVMLALCAAVVYVVDPCLYYRIPDRWQPVFFSERYQMAGLARNVEADTVLVGTSMLPTTAPARYRRSLARPLCG